MLARRIVPCLDVRDGRVVKGVRFSDLREAGDPARLAARYEEEGADEIVILDVTATLESRRALTATIEAASERLFIPLTVGGGIRSVDDARAIVEAGADKVSVNTAALRRPALITELARTYGAQAVVVAIDARFHEGAVRVFSRSGSEAEAREVVSWAREVEERGAGEILLTSIERDGTGRGFDCDLTAEVATAVRIPVIASGGGGRSADFVEVFNRGRADAALAASLFHDARLHIADLKRDLAVAGVPVRREGGRC